MASPTSLTHLFAELSLLEDMNVPLRGSSRLRYTCMSVSRQYIALGSNTGCVYVFGRDSLKHVKSIYGDVDASPVTRVAISPNQLNVALAVSSGQVAVMEMNIERRSKPERLRQTADHLGAMVTAMVWDFAGTSLFVADSMGKVTQVNVPLSKAKSLFVQPSLTIVRLDCGVIQLDWWGGKLLASSLTRTYLLNTEKEGEFGACFFLEPSSNYPVIYCARPGSRMWEVDFEGNVLNTHQFKQLLATPPLPIVTTGVNFSEALQAAQPGPQSVNFVQMLRLREFILTWSSKGLYVFDPINVKVVLWTDTVKDVNEVCVIKNEVYILFDTQQVRRLLFLPILHLCAALVTRQRCLLAAELLVFVEHFTVNTSVLKHVKKELLPQLIGFLREEDQLAIAEKVQALLEDVSDSSMDSEFLQEAMMDGSLYPSYATQNSGIVVVNDGTTVFGDSDRRASPNILGGLSQMKNESGRSSPQTGPASSEPQLSEKPEINTSKVSENESTAAHCSASPMTHSSEETLQMEDLSFRPEERRHESTAMLTEVAQDTEVDHRVKASSLTASSTAAVNDETATDGVLGADSMSDEGGSSVTKDSKAEIETEHHSDTEEMLSEVKDPNTNTLQDQQKTDADFQPSKARTVRRVSSMPAIVVEDSGETTVVVSDSRRGSDSLQPRLSPVLKTNSGSTSDGVAKATKKKKRRRVNEVNIPMAGSSSGEMKRSLSTGTLKQKKKKEFLKHGISFDSSDSIHEEDLYQQTEADPETVSISTISSIEEESDAGDGLISRTTSVADDVFLLAAESRRVMPTSKRPGDANQAEQIMVSVGKLHSDDKFTGKPGQSVGSAVGESDVHRQSDEAAIDYLPQLLGHDRSDMGEEFDGTRGRIGELPPSVIQNGSKHVISSTDDSDNSLTNSYEKPPPKSARSESEVIPPLIERLSALGVAPASVGGEDVGGSSHDPGSVKSLISEASRQRIASVKERDTQHNKFTMTLRQGDLLKVTKFGSTTRSLIRRVKEKNPLVSRSPSESPPFNVTIVVPEPSSSKDDLEIGNILNPNEPSSSFTSEPSSTGINLDPLLKQTNKTQHQLKDYAVLQNPGKLKEVLETWVTELNNTLVAYHQDLYSQEVKKKKQDLAARMKTADKSSMEEVDNHKNVAKETDYMSEDVDDELDGDASSPVGSKLSSGFSSPTACEGDPKSVSSQGEGKEGLNSSVKDDQFKGKETEAGVGPGASDESGSGEEPVLCNGVAAHNNEDTQSAISAVHSASLNSEENSLKQDTHDKPNVQTANSLNSPETVLRVSEKTQHRLEMSGERSKESQVKSDELDNAEDDSEVDLHVDWSRVCHIKDPFQLSPQQHMTVSNLVSHCLECGCFGNAGTVFSVYTPGPKTVSAKDQALQAVPSSFKSFSDAYSSLPSQAEKILRQSSASQGSSSRHNQHSSAKSLEPWLSGSKPKGSESVSDEKCAEKESVSQEPAEMSQCPDVQHTAPNEEWKAAGHGKQSQAQENYVHSVKGGDERDEAFDKERALFVRLYYHFLPHWRLRRLLIETDGKLMYTTWCAVVTCCQALGHGDIVWMKIQDKDFTGAVDYLRSGILPNKHAFLGHIASLFGASPMKVTDFVWDVPRQVHLTDVLFLCRLHAKAPLQVLTRYLTLKLGATPSHSRVEVLKQLCTTQETKLAVLECLLHLHFSFFSSPSASSITSDMRLKASADNSRLSPEVISETLACLLALFKDAEINEALSTCWEHSYWPGCLRLLKQTDQWQRALQLEVKLDDLTLLNGQSTFGFTPRNVEEWKYLLQLYKQVSSSRGASQRQVTGLDAEVPASPLCTPVVSLASAPLKGLSASSADGGEAEFLSEKLAGLEGESVSCRDEMEADDIKHRNHVDKDGGNHLSWLSLGLLVAQHLGASAAVQLLRDCCHDGGGELVFNAEFYRTCLALAGLERQQKLVLHNMLEKVDSYLWAKKPVHLTPQMHYAVNQERSALRSHNTEDQYYHNLFARLSAAPVVESQLAEDPDCHWGVKANILRWCAVCQIPVTETVSHLQPGVFIFKCGHVFHKFCVPESQCPLC